MYFPNAFKKVFVPSVSEGFTLAASGSTAELAPGQLGLFDAKTYQAVTAAPASGNQTFIIAQGSYHTVDKIGPFHGGYKESIKSKAINPKYISKFFKVEAKAPVNQIVKLEVCNVKCDNTYRLRVDLKGSPALRFLGHNLYRVLDAYTGCCAADAESDQADPTIVAAKWAKQLVEYPLLQGFVSVEVKDIAGAVVADLDEVVPAAVVTAEDKAELIISVAYMDTKFGNCTFTVSDFYELEPLLIYASMVDESGDACYSNCFAVSEVQAPVVASGVGETVLRDLILSDRYLQDAFPDGNNLDQLRLREVLDNTALSQINRGGLYDKIYLLHNVPRLHNPSSTFDNDQYLLEFNVPAGTDTSAFEALISDILDLAGNGVELEVFEGSAPAAPTTTTTTIAPTTTTTTIA